MPYALTDHLPLVLLVWVLLSAVCGVALGAMINLMQEEDDLDEYLSRVSL